MGSGLVKCVSEVGESSRAGILQDSEAVAPRKRIVLDEADHALIDLLAIDGRMSNRQVAREIGLTEATVGARIRRLTENRVLRVGAVFDWEGAGYAWNLFLGVEVEGRTPRAVADEIVQLPHVHTVTLVFGSVDIWVHILATDREMLTRALTEDLVGIDGVRRVTANLSLETHKWRVRRGVFPATPQTLEFPSPVVAIDPVGLAVAAALHRDGRQSNREIARTLSVSEGTVRSRIRELEEAGFMQIVAQTDPNATGEIGAVLLVGIHVDGPVARALAQRLVDVPQALVVAVTAGRFDVHLVLAGADREGLIDFVATSLRQMPGVRSTETWDGIRVVGAKHHLVRIV